MKPVLVIWHDAADADEGPWVDRASAPKIESVIFHQVGYLLAIEEHDIVLVACVGKEQMGVRSQIPIATIKSMVELTEGSQVKLPRRRRKPKGL